ANIKEGMSEEEFVKEVKQALTVTSSPQTLKKAVSEYRSFNDDDFYVQDGFDGLGPKGKHDKSYQTEYIKPFISNKHKKNWDEYVSTDIVIKMKRKGGELFTKEEAFEYLDIMPNYLAVAAYKKGTDNGIEDRLKKDSDMWGTIEGGPTDIIRDINKEIGTEVEGYYGKQLKKELEDDEDISELFKEYTSSHEKEKDRFEGLVGDNKRIVTWMKLTPELENLDNSEIEKVKN